MFSAVDIPRKSLITVVAYKSTFSGNQSIHHYSSEESSSFSSKSFKSFSNSSSSWLLELSSDIYCTGLCQLGNLKDLHTVFLRLSNLGNISTKILFHYHCLERSHKC